MKRMQIFKAGTQTSSSGETSEFTEDHLRKTVEAYDPKLHEAPIVIGHPRDNAPAYGWISALNYDEGGVLQADTDQLEANFEEMVREGRFKKRSASFYKPDSPSNPVPGTYYLRHVGFLGAQPPAVKGLEDPEFQEHKFGEAVEFSDTPEDVLEFSDTNTVSTLFRRMRELLIDSFGMEKADQTLPAFLIEDLEDEARREREAPETDPAYSEQNPKPGAQPMQLSEQEIKDLQAKAKRADELETEVNSYKERESDIADRESKLARKEIATSVDALIDEGRVLPTKRESMIDYLESLDDSDSKAIEFSEGEGDNKETKKLSQRAYFLDELSKRPPVVDFDERSGAGAENEELSFEEVAEEARAYQDRELQAGRKITTTQAVKAVKAGRHK